MRKLQKVRGYTLVELLIVMGMGATLIAGAGLVVLAGIALIKYIGA